MNESGGNQIDGMAPTSASADFEVLHYLSDDGLQLYGRIYPPAGDAAIAGDPPIICLPGLSRNSRDFHGLALSLARAGRRVVTLDMRGRGGSARDPEPSRYNIAVEAGDVIAACRTLEISSADFIGTSRGGLILHVLAAARAELLGHVVLNDVGPELALEGLRQIQAYLGRDPAPADWDAAAAQLAQIHGADFPALTPKDWHDLAFAIYRKEDGGIVADFDPAIAAQLQAADLSQPLPDLWAQYAGFADRPLMVVRGEHSRLLTPEITAMMAARHPGLAVLEAKGQGHAPILHLDGLDHAIAKFLGARFLDGRASDRRLPAG